MSDSLVPKICGKSEIYVPDDGCSECMRELLLFKDEVHENYYTKDETYNKDEVYNKDETYNKTEVDDLIASAGGGYKIVDSLPAEGENSWVYLVPLAGGGYEQWIWTENTWVDLGPLGVALDKQTILTALGYEEIALAMKATDGSTVTKTILAKS